MNYRHFALAAAALPLAQAVHAETAEEAAGRFGALEAVHDLRIAPDGNKVAYIQRAANGEMVRVADLATGVTVNAMSITSSVGTLGGCLWSSSERLVCRARYVVDSVGTLIGFDRLFAVNADGTGNVQLSARAPSNSRGLDQDGGWVIDYDVGAAPGSVLMTRRFLPNDETGSHIGSSASGLGVEQVDTVTLKRKTVEPPRRSAVEYISDGTGGVRIMASQAASDRGYIKGTTSYFYRRPGSRDWQRLGSVDVDGGGFTPIVVDSRANVAWGFDNDGSFRSLYSVTLDGNATRQKVLGRDDVDIDRLVTIGREARVVGAQYVTERRETEYVDPALKALSAKLSKALPGQPTVDFVDADQGEGKLVIVTGGDTHPGSYYLYTKATRNLAELLPTRPNLADANLAEMKAVQYPAADGTMIPAYLTLPPGGPGKGLPAIVMPHGGPSARDEWGFDWLVQFFAARGYAVLQPNYRGSSGYGSNWYQKNGFQSWRTAIGDIDDGARWLVSSGIAEPRKLAVVGWSYGGYAALQAQAVDPQLYRAAVAIAPVADLAMLKEEALAYTSGKVVAAYVGDGAHVKAGSPLQNASAIAAPVLLFHGDMDQNVDVAQSRAMFKRLTGLGKVVQYVEFKGLDHQLADTSARTRLLSESDAFLRNAMGL